MAAAVVIPDIFKVPIDPSAYSLSGEELAFFKAQTNIQNEDELRDHILAVQAEAYAVCPSHQLSTSSYSTDFTLSNNYILTGVPISLYQAVCIH